jgi:phosphopantetheine--protein transferase-like protein
VTVSVGTDLIEIERIRRSLARYAQFRERCFTEAERAYCDSRPNPAQSYAGRFAGKEAARRSASGSPARSPGRRSRSSGGRSRPCACRAALLSVPPRSALARSTSP